MSGYSDTCSNTHTHIYTTNFPSICQLLIPLWTRWIPSVTKVWLSISIKPTHNNCHYCTSSHSAHCQIWIMVCITNHLPVWQIFHLRHRHRQRSKHFAPITSLVLDERRREGADVCRIDTTHCFPVRLIFLPMEASRLDGVQKDQDCLREGNNCNRVDVCYLVVFSGCFVS